ncbi:MAG TPA: phasin family protein [Spongiibacteraceae bacterium]
MFTVERVDQEASGIELAGRREVYQTGFNSEEWMMSVVETFKDKASDLISSAGDINKLAIDKVEEATKLNLASATYFSNIGIKQLRALSNVKDLESIQKFTADSISLSGEIVKKVLDDSKAWLNIGADVKDRVTSIFKNRDDVEAKKKPAVKSALA